jgi:flagellar protein FliO/FliZ
MENFGGQIVSTLIALAFVGVLAFFSLSLLKKFQQGNFRRGGANRKVDVDLRFVRSLQLGTKERVVVVHYDGDELLLGVTVGGISLLTRRPVTNESFAASDLTIRTDVAPLD